jgi:isochorismate pyruvate lyase
MAVQRTFSGTPWEEKAGYCRALRVGNQIFVSGTAPSDGNGGTYAPGDAYAQTQRCFEIIAEALEDLGSGLEDIVRTRLYVTDLSHWEDFARAHQELFADNPPVNTMLQIPQLMDPDMLVEVEVEVLLPQPDEKPPQPLMNFGRPRLPNRPIDPATYPPMGTEELDEGCLD